LSTSTSIRSYNLRTGQGKNIQSNLDHVIGVGFDPVDRRVYWTDIEMKKETIESASISGLDGQGGIKAHLTQGLDVPENVVIDHITRNLYFSDSGKGHIVVCDLGDFMCKVILKDPAGSKPRGLAIHNRLKLLFYTDWSEKKPLIASIGLDGSERKDIITTDIFWPNGVAIDQLLDRIFWCDAKLNLLESANLDGSDRKQIPVPDKYTLHPYGIAVFEDTLYWSDWTGSMLASCNKFTGKNVKVLIREGNLKIMGITVFHPIMKSQSIYNPCYGSPCSHICLPKPTTHSRNKELFTCACPDDHWLNPDGVTCHKPHFDTLIVTIKDRMYQMIPHKIGHDGLNLLKGFQGSQVDKVVQDVTNGNLVLLHNGAVIEFDVLTKKTKILSYSQHTSDIAFDSINRNIYWIDYKKKSIYVKSVESQAKKAIVSNLEDVKAVVFSVRSNKVIYLDGHSLVTTSADGHDRKILRNDLSRSCSMLYYDHTNDTVLIGDSLGMRVLIYEFQNRKLSTLMFGIQNLFDMVVHDGYFYWTQIRGAELFWVKYERGVSLKDLSWRSLSDYQTYPEVIKLAVSSNKSTEISEMSKPCLDHGCEKLCFSFNDQAMCNCEFGHVLNADRKTCKKECASELFACGDDQAECIPHHKVCDGEADCVNSKDEANCTVPCNPDTHYKCEDGECLFGRDHKCDYVVDCKDGSDELDCPPPVCDQSVSFLCKEENLCLPKHLRCDSHRDCKDGSDEMNCTSTCSESQYTCLDGSCIKSGCVMQ